MRNILQTLCELKEAPAMSWRPTLRHHVKSVIDLGSRWAHSDTSVCIQHFENLGRGNSSLALALHLIDCARCYAGHAFCHQCQQCTVQHSTRIYAHGLQAHKRLQHDGHDQCSCRRASCLASSSRCKELNTHHGAVPRTTRAGHASLGPRAGHEPMRRCGGDAIAATAAVTAAAATVITALHLPLDAAGVAAAANR